MKPIVNLVLTEEHPEMEFTPIQARYTIDTSKIVIVPLSSETLEALREILQEMELTQWRGAATTTAW